ncbi:polynucleotide adenylyltransferase PcnB [Candidatus Comchoanobacter bicostacola]|uniref:Polynucleotide adenylyltransferase PcnB n=1 Tax=Candidatus Comchoanobacter bicostacola TaxID=2919598 RepID=A0ABY5DL69_9GAMM|nr:polynucleotide adenylyltransferase PcnB [Candidatus Comchoanobacter bicostacola]UTC24424.1 polynucleotide adenylyltransferase PcnB [Candidatus Comchoanobacter bicostacola]
MSIIENFTMMRYICQLFKGSKPPQKIIDKSIHGITFDAVDPNAIKVLHTLNKNKYDAYLVGGAIRDLGSGLTTKDCDVVTSARPNKILKCFKRSIMIGKRFRLVHVLFGRSYIEVSTFRSVAKRGREFSAKGMIKRDNVYGKIHDDVLRRDFTINALYLRYHDSAILDYVGGWDDLKHKRLRSIGNAFERFKEDPIRILRAIRFEAKLGLTVDEEIQKAIGKYRDLLLDVPAQRMFLEVVKIYYSGYARDANHLMWQYGVFDILFSETVKANTNLSKQILVRFTGHADKRFAQNERLSVAYLMAVLYWPVCESMMRKKRVRGFSEELAKDILVKVKLEIPPRVSEAVIEIWHLQYQFLMRDKMLKRVLRSSRVRAAYDLLISRATVQAKLSDVALFWSEHIESR